jgi:hypothetical protein
MMKEAAQQSMIDSRTAKERMFQQFHASACSSGISYSSCSQNSTP